MSCATNEAIALPLPTTIVESLALAVAEPHPVTLAWFTCGLLAVVDTFTKAVIGG